MQIELLKTLIREHPYITGVAIKQILRIVWQAVIEAEKMVFNLLY